MLTARAEFRLRLRADNAETRLAPVALAAGCLGRERRVHLDRRAGSRALIETVLSAKHTASSIAARGAQVGQDGARRAGADWLRFAGVDIEHVMPQGWTPSDPAVLAEMMEDSRYAPYLERQRTELDEVRRNDMIALPSALDYAAIAGLSAEMIERLSRAAPATLGAAGRIRGITPAALSAILLHTRKRAA
jgi:tRNA uridine 5-carboxymethylaminomethyl modification enzyme